MRPDYPLRFQPIYKERIWGGDFGVLRPHPTDLAGKRIGESWEISDRPGENSRLANGPLAGLTLRELVSRFPEDLLGPGASPDQRFPLLIKFISTGDRCSLQVHPTDEYARGRIPGERGKTEMWYVLAAEPEARLLIGFRERQNPEEVRRAIAENRLENLVRHEPVRQGEAFFLPAGRIHGIGAGLLLAEVQDNSDLTYRIYDYGRRDPSGQPRDLHVEDALKVIDFHDTSDGRIAAAGMEPERTLVAEGHFRCEHAWCREPRSGPVRRGSQVLIVTEGGGRLDYAAGAEPLERGTVLLVPAGLTAWTLHPGSDGLGLLFAWVGSRE